MGAKNGHGGGGVERVVCVLVVLVVMLFVVVVYLLNKESAGEGATYVHVGTPKESSETMQEGGEVEAFGKDLAKVADLHGLDRAVVRDMIAVLDGGRRWSQEESMEHDDEALRQEVENEWDRAQARRSVADLEVGEKPVRIPPAVQGFLTVNVMYTTSWQRYLTEQLKTIQNAKIAFQTTVLTIKVTSSLPSSTAKVQAIVDFSDINHATMFPSRPARSPLYPVWLHCQKRPQDIFWFYGAPEYLVSKRDRQAEEEHVEEWRMYMDRFLIHRPELCLHALQTMEYDLCGVNYKQSRQAFVGDILFGRCTHVATLPEPEREKKAAKGIINDWFSGDESQPRVCSLHSSNVNHWTSSYPYDQYADALEHLTVDNMSCDNYFDEDVVVTLPKGEKKPTTSGSIMQRVARRSQRESLRGRLRNDEHGERKPTKSRRSREVHRISAYEGLERVDEIGGGLSLDLFEDEPGENNPGAGAGDPREPSERHPNGDD
mmetsp:Transcript_19506/g.54848  ORF Transcript_19506/g.54848 Transcript_19506/m.54848 type:complete len:488 (+) Transcript_19506:95-1558(+)